MAASLRSFSALAKRPGGSGCNLHSNEVLQRPSFGHGFGSFWGHYMFFGRIFASDTDFRQKDGIKEGVTRIVSESKRSPGVPRGVKTEILSEINNV